MKVGTEVEGRLKGLRTLFLGADEFTGAEPILAKAREHNCVHVYISDHEGTLDFSSIELEALGDALPITLELKSLPKDQAAGNLIPSFIMHIILEQPSASDVHQLRETDSVKFTSPDRDVYCIAVEHFNLTSSFDFNGDVEV